MKTTHQHLSTENGCRPNCPACAAEGAPIPARTVTLPTLVKRLVRELKGLGFGTDNDVNGADCVDVCASYFPDLVKATDKTKTIAKPKASA